LAAPTVGLATLVVPQFSPPPPPTHTHTHTCAHANTRPPTETRLKVDQKKRKQMTIEAVVRADAEVDGGQIGL
jgi:hypothetical protein